jgi:hypothetical protein
VSEDAYFLLVLIVEACRGAWHINGPEFVPGSGSNGRSGLGADLGTAKQEVVSAINGSGSFCAGRLVPQASPVNILTFSSGMKV